MRFSPAKIHSLEWGSTGAFVGVRRLVAGERRMVRPPTGEPFIVTIEIDTAEREERGHNDTWTSKHETPWGRSGDRRFCLLGWDVSVDTVDEKAGAA